MKKLMALGILASSFAFASQPSEVTSMMHAPAVAEIDCEQQDVLQIEVAPVKASYGYVSLGLGPFPIPMPLLGVGGRWQNGHNGFDASIQFISFGRGLTLAKENIDYLYYFKPNLASQFYVGGGLGFTEVWSHRHMQAFLSPQLVFGKQYTNEAGGVRYFQAQIDPVFLDLNHLHKKHHNRFGTFPAVVISYGVCF